MPALATVYDGLVAFRRSGGAAGAHARPRPGHYAAAPGRRRHDVHVHAPPRESVTPTARPCGRPTSAAASSASSASAPIPPTTKASSARQRATEHPRRCDLSAGIVTDDAAGTVTFHLGQADPDFLYKLALVLAAPAPPGAPGHVIRPRAVPARHRPVHDLAIPAGQSSLTLVRNPYFRQWSYAAQPAGYPYVIRYEQMADPERAGIGGHRRPGGPARHLADGDHQSLAIRYPARVHSGLKLGTAYCLSQHPPAAVHQPQGPAGRQLRHRPRPDHPALHLAPGQATATCQMLPPDFPGHQRYCPYTTGAEDGAWHGPDMAKARAAGHGIRHHERAGDRLELQRRRGQGGRLLPRRAPRRSGIPGQPARSLR